MTVVVVVTSPSGDPRVFGGWHTHAAAVAFVRSVNARIETLEDEDEFAEYAVARIVRRPRVGDAAAWALAGEEPRP